MMNNSYKKRKGRLWTWTNTNGKYNNQLDYIKLATIKI